MPLPLVRENEFERSGTAKLLANGDYAFGFFPWRNFLFLSSSACDLQANWFHAAQFADVAAVQLRAPQGEQRNLWFGGRQLINGWIGQAVFLLA